MIIEYEQISEAALRGVAEQFVIAQLSDLDSEPTVELWVDKVIQQVKAGELLVEFSQVNDSVTLKSRDQVLPESNE